MTGWLRKTKFELRHHCKRFISLIIVKDTDVYLLKSLPARVAVNGMAVATGLALAIARTAPVSSILTLPSIQGTLHTLSPD